MPAVPNWAKDPSSTLPDRYQQMLVSFSELGELVRTGEMSKRALQVATGLTEHSAYTLYEIFKCRGETSKTVDSYEFTKEGIVRELPSLNSWDKRPESPLKDISWMSPEEEKSITDLINHRTKVFNNVVRDREKSKVTVVDVNLNGPIAICHLGDPHVDDDGCNWPKLLRTIETISATKGMYAGNIGDTTNNWVGRLERLYAKQSTTYDEGIRLAEWLLKSVPYIYVMLGNHDLWNRGSVLMKRIMKDASVAVCTGGTARVELRFPKGKPIRLMARHDFKGSSSWNRGHGGLKASKLDPWADVYVSGHKHHWVQHVEEGMDGSPRWSLTVRGYKWYDSFAEEKGFYEHQHGECCTTILDPTAPPTERVRIVWDVEEAADLLKYLRRRAGYS